jgi:hypothetical protein
VHWKSWADYQKFWGQLVRWVSREGSDRALRASRSVEGETGALTLDAMDEAGNFLNGLALSGAVVDPDFQSEPLEVRQVAPGRYRAEFPAGKKGTYIASFRYQRDGQPATYSTGLSVPYSPEFRHFRTNQELLQRIAGATLGKVIDPEDPGSVFARDFKPARSSRELWRELVKAAAVLFFLDVFVRRVAVDYRKLLRRSLGALGSLALRRRRAAGPADERLGTLLKAKSAARASREGEKRFYDAAAAGPREPLDERFVAGSGPARSPRPGPAPPAAREPEKPAAPAGAPTSAGAAREEEPSYTSRLLAAKRRALEKRDGNEGVGNQRQND